MKTFTEKRFAEWNEDEIATTLRYKSGSCGGGSEVLVVCSRYVQRPAHRGCDDDAESCENGLPQNPVRDIDL